MALSALDLYSVGIGPSSSHTVGPMRAAKRFAESVAAGCGLNAVKRVKAELFGSLGATGIGHGSDKAIILGLTGEDPETVEADGSDDAVRQMCDEEKLSLAGTHPVRFSRPADVVLHRRKSLPAHPNGMKFSAFDEAGQLLIEEIYYSIGGGFVVTEEEAQQDKIVDDDTRLPYPFTTAAELVRLCRENGLSISELMLANERAWRPDEETRAALLHIWDVMRECVTNGCTTEETILPGGLKVSRRAAKLHRQLTEEADDLDPIRAMDWVNLFALAVNEENAAGGRVVTAPTNGAAGIVPAVLHYYAKFIDRADDDGVLRYLLTAAAVGILYKENASISGAEVGCQGEVGSACSMAAAGLCEVLGGTVEQVENAAEIGIEHNLGLTCDPVGGLVQIPCIERNAIASSKAINAARLAMKGDGRHTVSLDQAIKTMADTGADMKTKYKETSRGGLAVNVTEC
ncbi:serine dehydratase alpha family protein [Arthrobacter pigmenti]